MGGRTGLVTGEGRVDGRAGQGGGMGGMGQGRTGSRAGQGAGGWHTLHKVSKQKIN